MDKRMLAVFALVLVVLLPVTFGCKSKVDQTAQAPLEEAIVVFPTQEQQAQVIEPVQAISLERTAAEATMERAAEPLVSSAVPESREKQIQRALMNAGYYSGKIDGIIGPQSKKAVQEFQGAAGLQVDGKVGPKTWAELEKYLTQ